jgi:hypothetical protein
MSSLREDDRNEMLLPEDQLGVGAILFAAHHILK